MARRQIRLDIWTVGLEHHHELRAYLCNTGPGLCWAQQLQGSFCFQGADSFVKVTVGSSHGVGKACSTFSTGAAGCRACGGNKTKNPHWSACWWTCLCAQASSTCETRLKAQGPRAPRRTSGCLTFPSLKMGWRPRAFGDRVCGSKAHVPAFLCVWLGFCECIAIYPKKSRVQHSAL